MGQISFIFPLTAFLKIVVFLAQILMVKKYMKEESVSSSFAVAVNSL